MNRDEFFGIIEKAFSTKHLRQIYWAYWLAKRVHQNEKRKTGERYFEHCRRVVYLLIGYNSGIEGERRTDYLLDKDDIILGFLHDCEENGFLPRGMIEQLFGERVAQGLECLSKIEVEAHPQTGIILSKKRKSDGRYFADLQNAHFINIKIADRIDNLRSMGIWTKTKQKEYIEETEKYIVPLSQKLDQIYHARHSLSDLLEKELDNFYKNRCSFCGEKNAYHFCTKGSHAYCDACARETWGDRFSMEVWLWCPVHEKDQ